MRFRFAEMKAVFIHRDGHVEVHYVTGPPPPDWSVAHELLDPSEVGRFTEQSDPDRPLRTIAVLTCYRRVSSDFWTEIVYEEIA